MSEWAICVDNTDCELELTVGGRYRVLPDVRAAESGDVRVVDDTGEDYLYEAGLFKPTPPPSADREYRDVLNVEEAAEFLGFNPYTIREKARLGEIPARKIGREWRFSRRQILEFIEGGT